MIARSALGTKDHRLAFQILDHNFLDPVVEQIAYRQAAPARGTLNASPA